MSVNGIFNVNKPAGMTSFDVVAAIRRVAKERRVGHAGTLDPLAVGVLPVCVGQATRIVEYLTDSRKAYCAEIELGIATDTDDAEGRVIARVDPSGVSREQLEQTLASFVGEIEQIPPRYSAIKVGGKKLYQLARAGAEVEAEPRRVKIYSLRLITFEPPLVAIDVECSKGTYIRSIARDLGLRLGVGAYLRHLVRTRSGPFTIDEAVPLAEVAQAFELDYWRSIIYPVDEALLTWDAIIVGPQREQALYNGQAIASEDWIERLETAAPPPEGGQSTEAPVVNCRAYGLDGQLIAVVRLDRVGRLWRPQKVFSLQE